MFHGDMNQMPQRKHLRLAGYNYSSPGYYFVTICTRKRVEWFADIHANKVCLSAAGEIVQSQWNFLPTRFPGLKIDQFVIMPNHVHGIIVLTEHLRYRGPTKNLKPTLSNVLDAYKGAATYFIRRTPGFEAFGWQISFYDIIVPNALVLQRIRRYIVRNPERWISDRFYVNNATKNVNER